MTDKPLGRLTFGFDIGIASVGWCVLGEERIIDLGVRCFDAAEDNDGKPHNQTRRGARVARNRYRMRSWRLKRLVRLFRDVGMLSKDEMKFLFSSVHPKNQILVSPWELRSKGITQLLTPKEWAQVIFHIVKNRGFKFFSKAEDPTNTDEEVEATTLSGKTQDQIERDGVKNGLNFTSGLLKKYPTFRTIGNAAYLLANAKPDRDGIYRDASGEPLDRIDCVEFQESFRNKEKSYRHAVHRDHLRDELTTLFDIQQLKHNPHTDLLVPPEVEQLGTVQIGTEVRVVGPTFRDQVLALLELQHPPIYSSQMDALIGDCELESEARNGKGKAERRASKHSFSNERATWLQTLNNLRIKRNGKETELSKDERDVLLDLPYTQTKLTFKQAREKLRETLGFPAHWHEASFTKVTYRNKRKNDGSWINIVSPDGKPKSLGKYGINDEFRKKANRALKDRLETGAMTTFADLRQLYGVSEGDTFEHIRRDDMIIVNALESTYSIPFADLENRTTFVKILQTKCRNALVLKGKAMKALSSLYADKPDATLAELRTAIEAVEKLETGWQFEVSTKKSLSIHPAHEATTRVPIEYEDAQKVEEETLIELKGWHALKRPLCSDHPDWWQNLELAWRNPQSEAGQAAAQQIDSIAEVLTKAQTDADLQNGLAELGLTDSQIKALEQVQRFTQFRNLSLKALRNILPSLEQGRSYADACALAGYKSIVFTRTRHLPPLETCVYERTRHGKRTGYKELRYKDLTNPVVARAFNQARLVLNALIDRYDQSPAYVHVELSRDLAKSKEKRDEAKKRQDENRGKRERARAHFIENYMIDNPTARQLLKERLYNEQQCHCLYSLKKLDPDRVVRDENYAQIDHIWPRSLTFDNSMENLVLVHANENQDKGNDIPSDFIKRKHGEDHWRSVQAWVLSCKGMSDGKQKRLLATELDADEFFARNLVDTRYVTRLFARMLRDHLLFDGQAEDKTEDIDPSEGGKRRLEKFHKTRVRPPQGGVTAFLRRGWLGDIKDRDASDKHHALDACIVAACSPAMIHRINSYFANEEKVPNRYRRNADQTYTDRVSGEVVSKQEARERGLYLPPPWDNFRREFLARYQAVMVSRATRNSRQGELHDANPLAYRNLSVPLVELRESMLSAPSMPAMFKEKHKVTLDGLVEKLRLHGGNAETAFAEPHEIIDRNGNTQSIRSIALPLVCLPQTYLENRLKPLPQKKWQAALLVGDRSYHRRIPLHDLTLGMLDDSQLGSKYLARNRKVIDELSKRLKNFQGDGRKAFQDGAHRNGFNIGGSGKLIRSIRLPLNTNETAAQTHKTIPLTNLSLDKLSVEKLGAQYYHRNRKLVDAIKARLIEFKGVAKKAFDKPFDPTPYGKPGPIIRSLRLPQVQGAGMRVRGGITGIGNSICTEVHWTGQAYFCRPRYQAGEEVLYGLATPPEGSQHLFNLRINDLVEVVLDDGSHIPGDTKPGYFVVYEANDGRMRIRTHDRPGKSPRKKKKTDEGSTNISELEGSSIEHREGGNATDEQEEIRDMTLRRFSVSSIRKLRKFKADVLGDYVEVDTDLEHGLA